MLATWAPGRSVAGVALAGAAAVAVVGTVGGDARWVAAVGAAIAARGHVISEIPFASASTAGWHNPLALAELAFHWLYALDGDRALALSQMGAVATAFLVLGRDARRAGASDAGAALALLCLLAGAFPALAVVRLQLFSIALFPIMLGLLREEQRRPSWRIWLAVPLLAVWSNLHGGVVLGLLLALIYLLVDRARVSGVPVALAAACACVGACFLNPAFLGTPSYFLHLFGNELAVQHAGLWRHFSFHHLDDLVLLVAATVLVVAGRKATHPRWEIVAVVVLAISAADASRGGVWLLAMLVAPAATGLSVRPRPVLWAAVIASAVSVALVATIEWPRAPDQDVIRAAIARAHGAPILAEGALAEQVAVDGGRIWAGNPMDAFSRADQRAYLAWLDGKPSGDRALRHSSLILVRRDSPAAARVARAHGAKLVFSSAGALLYVLRR